MIPHYFQSYIQHVPLLKEFTHWEQLKVWDLAAVYRVNHLNNTYIVKWGGHEMKSEGNVYRSLLKPLHLPSPRLISYVEQTNHCLLILEDVGQYNLEQKNEAHFFIEAAKQLAHIRNIAIKNSHQLPQDLLAQYTLPETHFISLLEDISHTLQLPEQQTTLHTLKTVFPTHITNLYTQYPLTIVHHDFMAKNLMITNQNTVIPIDWSITYFSSHLGDLYNFIDEAKHYANLSKNEILEAFLAVSNQNHKQLDWELCIGGLCWLIKTLRWLTYGGTDIIPGSEAWIPDLFQDLSELTNELELYNIN